MLEIKNFVDCPEVLPQVAEYIFNQWFAHKPGHTLEGMLARMRGGKRSEIPIGLVAFLDGKPAGTVSLLQSDLEERKDLTPWLAGLLVFPEFRKYGVGSALVHSLVETAVKIKYSQIYLYTEIPNFYEKLGWKQICPAKSEPQSFIMMWNLDLTPCSER
jgi:predicted N-acetyltransferase YhbS